MIIVTGHLTVEAARRDDFVTASAAAVRQARETEGCLDFSVSADPVEPTRVNVSERWTDRASLEAFRGDGPPDDLNELIIDAAVAEFTVDPPLAPPAQTAEGKVLLHFSVSLDGFVAGPDHDMDWLGAGFTGRDGVVDEYVATTGAILGGRDGWDAFPDPGTVYGGAWSGPIFVLTHHPEDATPAPGVTFLDCDVADAVRIALDAADGKNVEVLSPTIGRQLLQRGLVDEIDLHITPTFLGDGIRLYDQPGGQQILLQHPINGEMAEIDVRYRPVALDGQGTRTGISR